MISTPTLRFRWRKVTNEDSEDLVCGVIDRWNLGGHYLEKYILEQQFQDITSYDTYWQAVPVADVPNKPAESERIKDILQTVSKEQLFEEKYTSMEKDSWYEEQCEKLKNRFHEQAENYFAETHDEWMKRAEGAINMGKKKEPDDSWKNSIVAFRDRENGIILRDGEQKFILGYTRTANLNIDALLAASDRFEIFTVKNDAGIEFSLGDETNHGKIQSFGIVTDDAYPLMSFIFARCDVRDINMNSLRKAEKKEFLWTTHDGVKIYEGDTYWGIDSEWNCVCSVARKDESVPIDSYFSTREKVEEYIRNNKPSISWQSLVDYKLAYKIELSKKPVIQVVDDFLDHFKPKQ